MMFDFHMIGKDIEFNTKRIPECQHFLKTIIKNRKQCADKEDHTPAVDHAIFWHDENENMDISFWDWAEELMEFL